jgi:hypothetical protein
MNLYRGGVRLSIGLAVVWFVFWTFAYVIHPYSSLRVEPSFAIRVTAWSVVVPCLISIIVFAVWTVVGLRRNLADPLMRG